MTFWHDVRDAARQLRRSPGFTAAAVLSLALGIGANTAIFTLLDQVLLRPLPVAAPEQLVTLDWEGPQPGIKMFGRALSYPAYRDLRERNTVFSDILARYPLALSVSQSGGASSSAAGASGGVGATSGAGPQGGTALVQGELVSGNYFEVLGVRPAVGRLFTDEDNRVPGGHPLAVLSYDYWTAQFNADPTIVGRKLIVDGLPLTVIGVSQRGFDGVELGLSPKVRIPDRKSVV